MIGPLPGPVLLSCSGLPRRSSGRTTLVSLSVTFQEFAQCTEGQIQQGDPTLLMQGISLDTRTLRPGEVFLALPGERCNGHAFVKTACQRGAQGIIVQRPPLPAWLEGYRGVVVLVPHTLRALQSLARAVRRRSQAVIIGVSGSNGKTTTKEMLAEILTPHLPVLVTRGNLNNQIGLPMTLLGLTPEHRLAVLEVGVSSREEMQQLVEVAAPTIGLLTNIGKAHLAGFGSVDGVFAAKRVLLDALPMTGRAIINLDDPFLAPLASHLSCPTLTFGLVPEAQIRAADIQETPEGFSFTLEVERAEAQVTLHGLGRFNVMNALAAAAAACAVERPLSEIVQGLQRFQPTAMRMQPVMTASGALLINDAYNANPSSMRAAIDAFCRRYTSRTRYLVLGDMLELGSASAVEHRALGAWLAGLPIAGLFVTGVEAQAVGQGAREAHLPAERIQYEEDHQLLAEHVRARLTPGAAIFFKASRAVHLEAVIRQLMEDR